MICVVYLNITKNIMIGTLLRKQIIQFKLQEKYLSILPMVYSRKQNRGWMAQIISNMDRV